MYHGTIVVLHEQPRFNGDAYFTQKSNYGLNVQVCGICYGWGYMLTNIQQIGNIPSNL
jgi:hypothetical protein